MKKLLSFVTLLTILHHVSAQDSSAQIYSFKEAGISIDLPNSKWHEVVRKEANGVIVYLFKRDVVTDSSNRQIIPNIGVIIENVPDQTDVITYSLEKRTQTPFDVLETFIHGDRRLNYKNAVAYKGTYTDADSLLHTIYVVHAINKNKGMQIVLDTTAQTFAEIEEEFISVLRSLRT